jgi:hypothetical protein
MMPPLRPFALIALAFAFLAAIAGTVLTVRQMVSSAVETARLERDAHWMGEIAMANEQTALAQLIQTREKERLDAEAREAAVKFQQLVDDLEHANEALPDNSCGLDADRVRLLRKN